MVFINYRRDDTRLIARALAEALRHRFGPHQVFLDESSIRDGTVWPEALHKTLSGAKVVLSLIGPAWLSCADQYGRRRIDSSKDWVRTELLTAHSLKKKILIRTVGGQLTVPVEEALPDDLQWLPTIQSKPIYDRNWYDDVDSLMRTLKQDLTGTPAPSLPVVAPGEGKVQELTLDQIAAELKTLKGWEPVQSLYPPRQELRKLYVFRTFRKAVGFMEYASSFVDGANHHPRWENQWKTVTVYFSTWDAGCQITQHDIRAARAMDDWYTAYLQSVQA